MRINNINYQIGNDDFELSQGGRGGCCSDRCPDEVIERCLRTSPVNQLNRLIPNVDQFFPFSQNGNRRVVTVQYGNQVSNLGCSPVEFEGALGIYRCNRQGILVEPTRTQPLNVIDVIVCWVCCNGYVSPVLACFGYQC